MILDIWDLKKTLSKYQDRARARSEERRNINDDTDFQSRVIQEILIDVINKQEVLEKAYEIFAGQPVNLEAAITDEKQRRLDAESAKRAAELAEAAAVAAKKR